MTLSNLPNSDKLFLLSALDCRVEARAAFLLLLPFGAIDRCLCVEFFPHDLAVDAAQWRNGSSAPKDADRGPAGVRQDNPIIRAAGVD